MQVINAYKTELDPNNVQCGLFNQYAGTTRFVFNWGLATWKFWYEDDKKPSEYSLRKHFNSIKDEECSWIRGIPYAVTESAFGNLGNAFKHFFRRVKNGETPGYPRFKNRNSKKSFSLRSARIEADKVRLTGVGWVKLKERAYLPQSNRKDISFGVYATISEKAGRWYIAILTNQEIPDPQNESTLIVGADFGLKTLVVLSNGETFENPHCLIEAERQLKRTQRELARRKKGGANWQKTKAQIQRQYVKVTRIRKHVLHDVSSHITKDLMPRTIVLENLNVSGMMANHHLAKAVSDVGFYELRRQIEYKAARLGIEVVIADRWFASSKTCSVCGWKKENLKLSDRTFQCDECGLEIDRDLNAAKNLAGLV